MAQALAAVQAVTAVVGAVQAVRSTFKSKKDKGQPDAQATQTRNETPADSTRRQAQERQRRAAAARSERSQNILTSPQGVAAQTQLTGQKTVLGG